MSEPKAAKLSIWQTFRAASGPYRRLFSYVAPYKFRFGLGLAFGALFGVVNGFFPLVVGQVTSFVFHGAAPNPQALMHQRDLLTTGPKINSIITVCLLIPAVMAARSFCSFFNAYYMNWVSNRVITDVRDQLFRKMVWHSMDFFNRMRSGFLMSRITNDTR